MTAPLPSTERHAGTRATLAGTLGYAAIVVFAWGSNYPLMKRAIVDMAPLTFSATRLWGAAAVVALLIQLRGDGPLWPPRGERATLGAVGLLQFASVLGLTGIALQFLPAGRAVTVVYSMPVWAALFTQLLGKGRLSRRHGVGIVLSLAGLMLFVDPAVVDWQAAGVPAGMALVLAASILWGLGAAFYSGRRWQASMLCQTLWQLIAAAIPLSLAALAFESDRTVRPTPALLAIVAWNWVVPTALALWAWGQLLNRVPSAVAGQLLALTPLVGILCSGWMFQESLPPTFALCAALIAAGSCLVLLPSRGSARVPDDGSGC
jgi:drug/metabolite transporter (DMT)-like permease